MKSKRNWWVWLVLLGVGLLLAISATAQTVNFSTKGTSNFSKNGTSNFKAPPAAGCVAVPGIVAHWPMNDGANPTVADTSGNGFTMYNINAPTWVSDNPPWTDGGKAITYSAASSQYSTNATVYSAVTGGSKLSFSAWVSAPVTAQFNIGFDGVNDYNNNTLIGIYCPSGTCYLQDRTGGTFAYASFTWPANSNMHFIVFVFDGTQTGNARYVCYMDGVLQTVTYNNGPPPSTISPTGPFDIGYYNGGSVYPNATVTDVRVYNTALQASDVTTLWQAGAPNSKTCP